MTNFPKDNPEKDIEQIVQQFVDAQLRGENPDIDDFVKQYPGLEDRIRQRIHNLREIDGLFASLMQPDASDFQDTPAEHDLIGQKLGDFEIVKLIGRGGMGAVFLAHQISLDRDVALKVVSDISGARGKSLERFKREAKVLAKISHPNIVPIYEVGEQGPYSYFAMEHIKGVSLDKILTSIRNAKPGDKASDIMHKCLESQAEVYDVKQQTDSGTVAEIDTEYIINISKMIIDIATALDYAHKIGILHRDVKPSNILIDSNGTPKLVDFGLARVETQQTITISGEFFGTPNYVSPEQINKPENVDCRSDVYSLAATYYECLTLHPPFEGNTVNETLTRVISKEALPPKKYCPRLSNDFNTVLLHALEKSQEDRYQNAADFAADIENVLDFKPITAKRPSITTKAYKILRREPLKIGLVVIMLLMAGIFGYWSISYKIKNETRAEAKQLFDMARGKMTVKNYAEALKCLDQALEKTPDFIDAYLVSAECQRYLGNYDRAIKLYKQAISIADNNPMAYFQLGQTFIAIENWEQAKDEFKKAIELDPNFGLAHAGLATCYLNLGINHDAISEYRRAIALGPNIAEKEQILFIIGNLLTSMKIYEEAIQEYQKLLDINPMYADAYIGIGHCYMMISDHSKAENSFKKAVDVDPKSYSAYATLAQFYVDSGRTIDAISAYSSAADICLKEKRIQDALDCYDKVTSIDPNYSLALMGAGDCYFDLKNYNEAVKFYHKALNAIPYDKLLKALPAKVNLAALMYIKLGKCYTEIGQFSQAEHFYLQSIESEPNFYKAYVLLALHYWTKENRYEDAINIYNKALAIEPRDKTVYFSLGMCNYGLKNYEEAIKSYEIYLEIAPNDSTALFFVGKSYQMLGHAEKSLEYLQRAIAIDPNNYGFLDIIAAAYAETGDFEKAVEYQKKAIELADDSAKKEYEKRLEAYKAHKPWRE
jgi:tetratricopeptide (TPR) repeat protein/serine/threonine protein kinase